MAARHPGKSGIHPLADAHDAFAARMMLVRAAQRSLDVQYYIWHDDMTGTMLLEALHAAADRGVRVRLLLQGKVEYRMQYHATRSLYDQLLRDGIEIYEYMPSYLHAKVAVIDNVATV
ncbi:phospholipase D-like domain-containing protein, partial [Campylobacter lari]|nr:phospholipase D-like domain-containing protein [Campylobacter lari]